MKKQMLIMAVAITVLMLAEYRVRGYAAIGAEVLIVPLWILALSEYRKWKGAEAK